MKQTKATRTKAFILEKVAPIFNTKGYEGTSLTDILKATGLTKGSVYGNFKNKEDLALQAFQYSAIRVLQSLQEQIGKNKSASKKARELIEYYRNYYTIMLELGGCPIVNVSIDAKGNNELLFKAAAEAGVSIKLTIEEIILLGIKQKRFKKKTDAKNLASVIYGMINGAVFSAQTHQDEKYLHVMADEMVVMIDSIKK